MAAAASVVLGVGASGCASTTEPPPRPVSLLVYAAASLKSALADAAIAYGSVHPGTTLTIATDSSATLRAQLEQGAPADVFLSADAKNPETLVAAGLTDGAVVPFAGNVLVVVAAGPQPAGSGGSAAAGRPAGSAAPGAISSPIDLARPGLRVIAANETVPLTTYAERVVANLAALPGYPAGFAAAYEANVVSREGNASDVVARVALGEGDAGIVYATDARAFDGVATVDIPAAANVIAAYDGVVLRSSPDVAEAHAFLGWLSGPAGRSILAAHGFLPPP